MTEAAFVELRPLVKTKQACRLLGKPRATHYRRLRPGAVRERRPRPTPANALSPAEREEVLDACTGLTTTTSRRPRCGPG